MLLVHVAILLLWLQTRPPQPPAHADGPEMDWIWILPQPKPATPPRADKEPAPARAPEVPAARVQPSAPPTLPPPLDLEIPPEPPAPDEPVAVVSDNDPLAPPTPAPAQKNDLVAQALRSVGKIDRDLRRERANLIRAPISTPQMRLVAGIEAAAKKRFGATEIEEIGGGAQGPESVRMYRVRTAMGTYCLRVKSNPRPSIIGDARPTTEFVTCPR
ncbi:MAG: hypothetical protein ACLGI6_21250 [Gammaproteobacteria bacterium]